MMDKYTFLRIITYIWIAGFQIFEMHSYLNEAKLYLYCVRRSIRSS